MKSCYLVVVCLILHFGLFADNVQRAIEKVSVESLPFECTKNISYPQPAYAFPVKTSNLPLATYLDLGLTRENTIPSIDFVIFRRFCFTPQKFDVIVVDISVSEWSKKLLTVYDGENLKDYLEVEVCWYPSSSLYIKQWRVDVEQNVVVTCLKVQSATPIDPFSDFKSVNAQRIDTHYRIDECGKFQLIKEVKYKPENYAKSYLIDKTKNLWEGTETPLSESRSEPVNVSNQRIRW